MLTTADNFRIDTVFRHIRALADFTERSEAAMKEQLAELVVAIKSNQHDLDEVDAEHRVQRCIDNYEHVLRHDSVTQGELLK